MSNKSDSPTTQTEDSADRNPIGNHILPISDMTLHERVTLLEKRMERTQEQLREQLNINKQYEERLAVLEAEVGLHTNKRFKPSSSSSRRPAFRGSRAEANSLTKALYSIEENVINDQQLNWNVCGSLIGNEDNHRFLIALLDQVAKDDRVKKLTEKCDWSSSELKKYAQDYYQKRLELAKAKANAIFLSEEERMAKKLINAYKSRRDRLRKSRKLATETHPLIFLAKGFKLEECMPLLEPACMSDEEDAIDNDGRKIIKRCRPCWRSQRADDFYDLCDQLYISNRKSETETKPRLVVRRTEGSLNQKIFDQLPGWSIHPNYKQ